MHLKFPYVYACTIDARLKELIRDRDVAYEKVAFTCMKRILRLHHCSKDHNKAKENIAANFKVSNRSSKRIQKSLTHTQTHTNAKILPLLSNQKQFRNQTHKRRRHTFNAML